ncbi:vitronectin-like isoform X2 [Anguilla anguilla]|uniref:vitronectin-like isoform X2 n=1 Tax=Anguilla anguilla TaxID=7936 RepID=UPI0015AE3BED|nr:vitronectin-like isoform X2 [Anguilla anguilla]
MHVRAILLLACVAAALAAEESCVGRCNSGFDSKTKCQCDSMCGYYRSCCVDYETTCSNKVTRGDTFHDPEQDYDTDVQNVSATAGPRASTSWPRFTTAGPRASTSWPRFTTVGPRASTSWPRFSTAGPRNTPAVAPTSRWPPRPSDRDADACSGRAFDSFMQLKNGSIYAFRGEYFFELDEKSVLPGYPKLIKDVWGISGPIDAAFTRINCQGKTYIFKGNKYWRFEDGVLDEDFPRDISMGFQNIPKDVDAAFAIPASSHRGKEKVYFFKGDQYYQYEFKNQPTHAECAQMSKDSPSVLFHQYTDLYCDQWTDVFDLLFQGIGVDQSGPRSIRQDWGGIRPPVDAVMAGRLYLTPVASSPHPAPAPSPTLWYVPGRSYKRPSGLRDRRRGRRRGRGRGRGRKQKRFASWDLFDIFYGDYDDSLEVAAVTEEPKASHPVQNVYFFTKDKYYRVDLKTKNVDYAYPPYPRSIGKYWLGCKDDVSWAEK